MNKILPDEAGRRARGRPPGALNRKTLGLPAHLTEELGHRDPAEVLAEIYSMDFKALGDLLGSKRGQAAMAMRIRAAEAAMPYLHAKMPPLVELPEEQLPQLHLHLWTNQMQQNQALIAQAIDEVSRRELSLEGQAIELKGEKHE